MEDWKCLLLYDIEAVTQVYMWQTGVSSQGSIMRDIYMKKIYFKKYIKDIYIAYRIL